MFKLFPELQGHPGTPHANYSTQEAIRAELVAILHGDLNSCSHFVQRITSNSRQISVKKTSICESNHKPVDKLDAKSGQLHNDRMMKQILPCCYDWIESFVPKTTLTLLLMEQKKNNFTK